MIFFLFAHCAKSAIFSAGFLPRAVAKIAGLLLGNIVDLII